MGTIVAMVAHLNFFQFLFFPANTLSTKDSIIPIYQIICQVSRIWYVWFGEPKRRTA
jgi:hypothetical protein